MPQGMYWLSGEVLKDAREIVDGWVMQPAREGDEGALPMIEAERLWTALSRTPIYLDQFQVEDLRRAVIRELEMAGSGIREAAWLALRDHTDLNYAWSRSRLDAAERLLEALGVEIHRLPAVDEVR